jgi:hypothetical protein
VAGSSAQMQSSMAACAIHVDCPVLCMMSGSKGCCQAPIESRLHMPGSTVLQMSLGLLRSPSPLCCLQGRRLVEDVPPRRGTRWDEGKTGTTPERDSWRSGVPPSPSNAGRRGPHHLTGSAWPALVLLLQYGAQPPWLRNLDLPRIAVMSWMQGCHHAVNHDIRLLRLRACWQTGCNDHHVLLDRGFQMIAGGLGWVPPEDLLAPGRLAIAGVMMSGRGALAGALGAAWTRGRPLAGEEGCCPVDQCLGGWAWIISPAVQPTPHVCRIAQRWMPSSLAAACRWWSACCFITCRGNVDFWSVACT